MNARARETNATKLALVFSQRNAMRLKRLSFPKGLLDARPGPVEGFWKEDGSLLGVGFAGNDRSDAADAGGGAIALAVVAFVGDGGAGPHVGPEIQQRFELWAVTGLSTSQDEGEGQAGKVGLEVDLRRETAPRAAERLILLPPFAPAAETWARTTVESNICTKSAVGLSSASASKKASIVPFSRSRQNRFQFPNSAGSVRHLTLCTVK